MSASKRSVFVTGGTGYMGQRLIGRLVDAGHSVRALVRPGSEKKLPKGCAAVTGNALDAASYATSVAPSDTFVHLVGISHPSPAKAQQFRDIDLASALQAIRAAQTGGVRHFVYVSVAHPAPMMKAYIAARAEAEAAIGTSGLPSTVLRPWYVLGPGHWWPYSLVPFYWVLERVPSTRESARRLGLVTIDQMTRSLHEAVEHPVSSGVRVVSVPEIRARTGTIA